MNDNVELLPCPSARTHPRNPRSDPSYFLPSHDPSRRMTSFLVCLDRPSFSPRLLGDVVAVQLRVLSVCVRLQPPSPLHPCSLSLERGRPQATLGGWISCQSHSSRRPGVGWLVGWLGGVCIEEVSRLRGTRKAHMASRGLTDWLLITHLSCQSLYILISREMQWWCRWYGDKCMHVWY